MESKLDELREHLQGIDVDVVSEEAAKLINRMDEQIRLVFLFKVILILME